MLNSCLSKTNNTSCFALWENKSTDLDKTSASVLWALGVMLRKIQGTQLIENNKTHSKMVQSA